MKGANDRNTGRERPPVGAMVGMERSILSAIAEDELHLVALSRVDRQRSACAVDFECS